MQKCSGRLYTSNPQGLKSLTTDGEIWQITRAGLDLPGTIRVKELAPSPYLFRRFNSQWKFMDPQKWWPSYEQLFTRELQTPEKINALRMLYRKLAQGTDVVLVCFCHDHHYCHRKLVGDFFEPYGIHAVELNPLKYRQLSLL